MRLVQVRIADRFAGWRDGLNQIQQARVFKLPASPVLRESGTKNQVLRELVHAPEFLHSSFTNDSESSPLTDRG